MDFGVVGLDGGSTEGGGFVSEAETRQRGCGSGFLKQGRSGIVEDQWMGLKMARNDDGGGISKAMLVQSKSPLLRSSTLFPDGEQQQQLLSFSAPKSDGLLVSNEGLLERSCQSGSLGYYHNPSVYARNAGLGSGSLNGSMHGMLSGIRGPFTPSQWMELEHQALIYKYLNANAPIPPNLLIHLRRGLNPSGFSGFSPVALRANTWAWGSFPLGFSGNMDPEPGRCRRTDGKKWRCSRDAVADQKYCERHMNRGRHRSRKPVEGQTGHAATSGTAAVTKAMPIATSSASAASGSGTPNSVTLAHQQQMKSLQPNADTSAMHISRMLMNKSNADSRMQDSNALSMLSSMHSRSKETQFTIPKQHVAAEESSQTEFGLVSSNLLLNPLKSSYVEGGNFNSSHDLNDREQQSHPLRHFIDDWPKSRPDQSAITWPEVGEVRSDRTQLLISIPVASSDFSSSTSSPTHEKLTLSPLKLSREFDPVQMGLGVGGALNEAGQKQASWIPISWENSMGGPLGEVLNKTNNTPRDRKYSSSVLNLMTEGWDASPRLRASPTGVLQKTTFTSISNSSTGSSPNRVHDHTSLCDDHLGSAFVNSTIPSL